MLRFFRKMRNSLLAENRFTRYFFYATGEIVLVVIGILIALQLNNWNATRKNNAEFRNTMEAFRQDLHYNIYRANSVIADAYQRDSLITLILNDKITRAMYRKNPDLRNVIGTMQYYTPIQDNLIAALSFENRVPNAYKPMLPQMKLLKAYLERWNYTYLGSLQSIGIYEKWLADNFYWYSQTDSLATESNIDFLLNNPIYRNKAFVYRKGYLNNTVYNTMFIRNQSVGILAQLIQLGENNQKTDLNAFFQSVGLHPFKQVIDVGVETNSKFQFRTRTFIFNATNQTITVSSITKDLKRIYPNSLKPGEFVTPGTRDGQFVEVVFENEDSRIYQVVADGYLLIQDMN